MEVKDLVRKAGQGIKNKGKKAWKNLVPLRYRILIKLAIIGVIISIVIMLTAFSWILDLLNTDTVIGGVGGEGETNSESNTTQVINNTIEKTK